MFNHILLYSFSEEDLFKQGFRENYNLKNVRTRENVFIIENKTHFTLKCGFKKCKICNSYFAWITRESLSFLVHLHLQLKHHNYFLFVPQCFLLNSLNYFLSVKLI